MADRIDRQTTPPFLLNFFYKLNSFHRIEDFVTAVSTGKLPQHLQVYTWHDCSLKELTGLILPPLAKLLPAEYAGTRIAYRLIYPDMSGPQRAGMQPRFIARDLGSVIVGAASVDANGRVIKSELEDENEGEDIDNVKDALKQMSGELTKELRDCRFVVGDYICAAILPPLPDGSVAAAPPPPPNRAPPPRSAYDGPRENGYGGRGGSYNSYGSSSRGGRGGRYDDRRDRGGFPQGDWSRGEAPPAPERDSYGRGRGGGRSYGRGDRMNR